jgi:hypothetical protein
MHDAGDRRYILPGERLREGKDSLVLDRLIDERRDMEAAGILDIYKPFYFY